MWTRDFKQTGNRILILLAQFVILLCFIIYFDFLYFTNFRPDIQAEQNFQQSQCLVMSKKLVTRGKFFKRYRAEFLVNYHANGAQYNRWVSGNGLDNSYSHNETSQEVILSNYDNGVNYQCWYDPKNAEKIILLFRQNWYSLYSFILPGIAGLIVLLFFCKSTLVFMRMMRENQGSLKMPGKL
ncbi:MAG TPA: hypothetical protein VL360_03805 [Gammaproteobacteria bacterium]|jgi:hypothetical protein|nr:hypothetical protein [Gammaproteobacteria bacterium]